MFATIKVDCFSVIVQLQILLISKLVNKRRSGKDDLTVKPSHTKVYFNDFVANALCDNMRMIIFDL